MAKEYIERDAVAKKAIYMHGFGNVKYVPLSAIMNQTAADVVEVVRCKDCVYRHLTGKAPFMFYTCTIAEGLNVCKENAFCSYGEKRDNNAAD